MPLTSEQLDALLPSLMPKWRARLRARFPRLSSHHADLVQDTAADLVEWARRQGGALPDTELVRRVAFRILERRVADLFRSQVAGWSEVSAEEHSTEVEAVPDARPQSDPELVLGHARLLRVLMSVLAGLSAEERALLFGEELGDAPAGIAMTDSQRKRVSRLRARLRELVEVRLKSGRYTRER